MNKNYYQRYNSKFKLIALVCFVVVLCYSCKENSEIFVYSNTNKCLFEVDGKNNQWKISPNIKPDRFYVYGLESKNIVNVTTDVDTIDFTLRNNDTIRFSIILGADTAQIEIVRVNKLPDLLSHEDKIVGLSKLWSELKYNFINIDLVDFDMDSLYRAYLAEILITENDYEYHKLLKKFVATFNDGHTEYYGMDQFYPFMDYIPLSIQNINEKLYITSVRKGVGLDSSIVGAEIIEIDGSSMLTYLKKSIFPYISASTMQHRWMQAASSIGYGLITEPFKCKVKLRNGELFKLEIPRNGEKIRKPDDEYWPPKKARESELVCFKWLENEIAYVNYRSFSPEDLVVAKFDKLLSKLYSAKGVIIDLRENGGGSTRVAWHLQKFFSSNKFFLNYAWETRVNNGVKKANGNWKPNYYDFYKERAKEFNKPDTIWVEDSIQRIKCPIAILIGNYTFSAAEDFLVNIYETDNRPILIGEETGGSTGSPLVVDSLPGNAYARICTRRICFPKSYKRFIKSGVKPDIYISRSLEDIIYDRDPVLDSAIIVIKKKL